MPSSSAAPRYRLADHLRACRVDEQVVLLDLQRDKYLGVGGPQLHAMWQFIVDWPVGNGHATPAVADTATDAWLTTLLRQGMLADASRPGPPPTPIAQALESLNVESRTRPVAREWHHLARLYWAAAVAAYWLERRCLGDIANSVCSLRSKARQAGHTAGDGDLPIAVSSYMRLRPFVFTTNDQCLHDSLTLIRFLARLGLFPSWVVGVRTRPFGAHSWVQSGSLVLNDLHENVRAYTPILVV